MTDPPRVVFGGELWPLGQGVTFVELGFEDAIAAYVEWATGWEHKPRFHDVRDVPVLEQMRGLLPFEMGYKRRLLVATRTGWTAVFDNSRGGGDIFTPTYLAVLRAVRAVAALHTPISQSTLPATQFQLFGPTGEAPLWYVRTIDAGIFDSGRWEFRTWGDPQPYEDLTAYGRRLIRERFTREMLLAYLAALGIDADNPDFYGEGVIVEDTGRWRPGWTASLEEARADQLS